MNVIFSVLEGFGVGEVAANVESCVRRGGVGRQDENESIYKRSDHKRDNERPTSKLVGDGAVETAALAELWRADSDAAAGAQFIDFVEQVHHIETDFKGSLLRDLDPA